MNPYLELQEGTIRIFVSEQLVYPEHMHSHVEYLFMLEGETDITISDSMYHLKEHDSCIIFPGQIHGYHSTTPNRIWLMLVDPSLLDSLQYCLQNCLPVHPIVTSEKSPEDVSMIINKLSSLCGFSTDQPESYHPRNSYWGYVTPSSVIRAWIFLLFTLLWEQLDFIKRDPATNVSLSYQLVQYISEHFKEPLSLDSIAKDLHINKYYLSHIFSEKLHISFPQYLNHLRVDYACQLMFQSSKSLSYIWEESGFSSQRSFNRTFLEIKGVSPLKYRKTILPQTALSETGISLISPKPPKEKKIVRK